MIVYLDNAASTAPLPEVLMAVTRAMTELYANPSSAHGLGAAAARAREQARGEVATLLRAQPSEIVFTSGGSEANALGLLGAAALARERHMVVSAIEHPAVLECAVTGAPDPDRVQVVKATVVLTKGYSPSPELSTELQEHVKKTTAPYKYPRIIEFATELPKTISGKIRRVEIRERDG